MGVEDGGAELLEPLVHAGQFGIFGLDVGAYPVSKSAGFLEHVLDLDELLLGGFVGLKRHQVAIPVAQLQERDGSFVLPGATKAAIKALPAFEYAKPSPARDIPVATRGAASKAESVSQ